MIRILAVLALAAGLSGCFTSDKPLIPPDKAAFPAETIVFHENGSDQPSKLVHERDYYVSHEKDGDHVIQLRLMPAGDNLYVLEMNGGDETPPLYLHAFLKVDPTAKTATSYKSVAPGKDDFGAGLHRCDKDQVCIDSLDAYVAYAKAAVAAGQKPDAVYEFVATP
jgi:hypothetical protein